MSSRFALFRADIRMCAGREEGICLKWFVAIHALDKGRGNTHVLFSPKRIDEIEASYIGSCSQQICLKISI